jgi:ribonuclease E
MRALFVVAAIALSVTAAQAQEMKPTAAAAEQSTERALPPTGTPTPTLVEKLKAAGELKDPKLLEAPAPKIDAVEAAPAEAKPVEAKPAEAPPVVAKQLETKPVDVKPVEAAKPVETKAVESKPVEAKPVETRPAQAAEAKPVKKRVVKKRETDEQKARRIAAKYGVSW